MGAPQALPGSQLAAQQAGAAAAAAAVASTCQRSPEGLKSQVEPGPKT